MTRTILFGTLQVLSERQAVRHDELSEAWGDNSMWLPVSTTPRRTVSLARGAPPCTEPGVCPTVSTEHCGGLVPLAVWRAGLVCAL